MRIEAKPGFDEAWPQAEMKCQEVNGALSVTAYDLGLDRPLADAEVEVTVANPQAACTGRTSVQGVVTFTAFDLPPDGAACRILARKDGVAREARADFKRTFKKSCTVAVGKPALTADPLEVDARADHLRLVYDFFVSFTGKVNVFDQFKKVDHKYREVKYGPIAEVPMVLACEREDGREKEELRLLRTAFCETVRRLDLLLTRKPLPLVLIPGHEVRKFRIGLTPAWIRGQVRVSATGTVSAPEQVVRLSKYQDGEGPLGLPATLTTCGSGDTFCLRLLKQEKGLLDLELLAAEQVVGQAPLARLQLPFEAARDGDAQEAFLIFCRMPYDFELFKQAAAPFADLLIKLARIASLYWYSDTGDVLMNNCLRGNLQKTLTERVIFLAEYYKQTHDDGTFTKRLPTKQDIDGYIGIYQKQVQAQADMLQATLKSDFLRPGGKQQRLYRGLSLLTRDLGKKFEPNTTAQLAGFSSAATDGKVAYHFVAESATDLATIHGSEPITPILILVTEGAEHGRVINPYSLHGGEGEVLFPNGVYPTNGANGAMRLVAAGPMGKAMKILDNGSEPLRTDSGIAVALSAFKQSVMQQQLIRVKMKKQHEEALKLGASQTRNFPSGDDPSILLVCSKMAPG